MLVVYHDGIRSPDEALLRQVHLVDIKCVGIKVFLEELFFSLLLSFLS